MECLACHTPDQGGSRFCARCGAPLPIPSSEADPLIGTAVGGRYRITGILGEGGMGRVYVGEQQMGTSVRKVAIKTLLAQFAKDPGTVARFMREVGTVSELEHPNTIKVFDFGQIEGSGELYIAMEMLQGTGLDEALGAGHPLQPERVDHIIGQVCGSLQEAHDKGVVHRDLKPANIFLTTRAGEQDVVKVLDFGIAKSDSKTETQQKLTQQGTILGTPPYMSPEQFTGKAIDRRSDIYSLAVVTYEMLTGRLPFEADAPWQWMTQHMTGTPIPFEAIEAAANVPFKMRQAVMHALAKDPNQRPATTREFFEELTLGAARMSALGLGSGGIASIPQSGGMGGPMTMGGPIGGPTTGSQPRPMGTQMGAPLFAEGGGPPGPMKTVGGFDPMAGMAHAPAVPTAGGHAFPTPYQATKKSGGSGAIIAVVLGLVVVGGGVGGFLYWRSTQTDTTAEDDSDGDKKPASSTKPVESVASAAETVASAASAKPPKSAPVSATAKPPPVPDEATWNAAPDAEVTNAAKIHCQTKNVGEWVRVVCVGKNDTGGTPKNVVIKKGNPATDRMGAKDAKTVLIFRFIEGSNVEAVFEWSDNSRTFKASWPKGSPKPTTFGVFDASPTKP